MSGQGSPGRLNDLQGRLSITNRYLSFARARLSDTPQFDRPIFLGLPVFSLFLSNVLTISENICVCYPLISS